ncbi:Polynucleotide 5'-hydroxyl-kinase grc3 [Thecaphora frezii]
MARAQPPAAPMSAVAARKAKLAAAEAEARAKSASATAASSPATTRSRRPSTAASASAATTPSKATPKSKAKAKATTPTSTSKKPAPTPPQPMSARTSRSAATKAESSVPSTPNKLFLSGTDPQVIIPTSISSATPEVVVPVPTNGTRATPNAKSPAARRAIRVSATTSATAATPASATRTVQRPSNTKARAAPEQTPSKLVRASTRTRPSPKFAAPEAATLAAATAAAKKAPAAAANKARKTPRTSIANATPSKRATSPASRKAAAAAAKTMTPTTSKSPAARTSSAKKRKARSAADNEEDDEETEQLREVGKIVVDLRGEDDDEDQEASEDEESRPKKPAKRRKSSKASDLAQPQSRQHWTSPNLGALVRTSRYFAGDKKGMAAHEDGDEEEEEADFDMAADSGEEAEVEEVVRKSRKVKAKGRAKKAKVQAPPEDESGFLAFGDGDSDAVSGESAESKEEEDEEDVEDEERSSDLDADHSDDEDTSSPAKFARNAGAIRGTAMAEDLASSISTPIAAKSIAGLMAKGAMADPVAKKPNIPYSKFTPVTGGAETNYMVDLIDERPESICFGLNAGESLAFVGNAKVVVLKGKLRVGAALLSDVGVSSIEVFAPAGYPVPALEAVGPSEASRAVALAEGLDTDAYGVIVRIEELRCEIQNIARACPIAGINPFVLPGRIKVADFPRTSSFQMLLAPPQEGEASAWPSSSNASLTTLEVPPNWSLTLEKLSNEIISANADLDDPVVALVRGAKKVGKSTFVKMAVNQLLAALGHGAKVAMLDLDLGQSEFGPPGSVVLHIFQSEDLAYGPSWCLPRIAARSHFIGDTSPKDDPASYMQAVQEIIAWFRAEVQRDAATGKLIPLVVNTQGWIKGLGADLGVRIETMLCPSHVYEIVPPLEGDASLMQTYRGEAYLDHQGSILAPGASITVLSGAASAFVAAGNGNPAASTCSNMVSSSNTRLSAADVRTLSIVSWFHATALAGAGQATRKTRWDFGRPILAMEPLIVDVATGLRGGLHVLPFGSSVPDGLKLGALNGSIVSIVTVPIQSPSSTSDGAATAADGASVWRDAFSSPRPSPSTGAASLGLALVRSIDPAGSIHLLSPLPAHLIAAAAAAPHRGLALVKGAIELPIWLSLDFEAVQQARDGTLDGQGSLAGVDKEDVPFLEWPRNEADAEGPVGSKKRKVRKNLMRRAQM